MELDLESIRDETIMFVNEEYSVYDRDGVCLKGNELSLQLKKRKEMIEKCRTMCLEEITSEHNIFLRKRILSMVITKYPFRNRYGRIINKNVGLRTKQLIRYYRMQHLEAYNEYKKVAV